ncbi:hypothetical protein BpHYR1_040449 [Brachionus plicatilis]|uniref:Uncharacterized protein n=1 Tax=Brachionus plicatilis TaxID=10195 RepID=A0A3M7T3N4_BRAPC|nr:hypothetical protein BpHYR1_040449 [Brachionus plicatilis]
MGNSIFRAFLKNL